MQLRLFEGEEYYSDGENIKRIIFPLIKYAGQERQQVMLVWLWVSEHHHTGYDYLHSDLDVLGKFALVWDKETDYWTELKPFEEYGKLKGVEYMLPHKFEEIALEYATKETDYYSYFDAFKLPLNSDYISEEWSAKGDRVATITTKQNRIPNAGIVRYKVCN